MSEYYDYTKPVRRRSQAVESNAARSPTLAGQHPNTVRDNRHHNPQHMYTGQGGAALTPQQRQRFGAAPPPPPPQGDDGFWKAMAVVGMLGLGYMLLKDKGDSEEEPRRNPAPEPLQQQPTVIVVPPAGVSVTAQPQVLPPVQQQAPQIIAAPQMLPPVSRQVVDIPQPVVQTTPTVDALEVSDSVIVEDTKKKARKRKTTQARDEEGHYLPAGTRARAVTEGKD